MKIELSRRELEEAIQDFVFKRLGETAYLSEIKPLDGSRYANIDYIEATIKD